MIALLLALAFSRTIGERKFKPFHPKKFRPRFPHPKIPVPEESNDAYSLVIPILRYEEGFRSSPYYCSEGYPTIGYGHLCSSTRNAPLSTCPSYISQSDAERLLSQDVSAKTGSMFQYSNINAAYNSCTERRKAILISMAFQLGSNGLSKFVNTLKYVANKDWSRAAEGMLDSAWARQTPNRAKRHAEVMRKDSCSTYGWY